MGKPLFYNYLLTNFECTVLYAGFTNNLEARLIEHWVGTVGSFTSKYKVHFLVWYETTQYVLNGIQKEKDLKLLNREKKEAIINDFNPEWKFLNAEFVGNWPPTDDQINRIIELRKGKKFG